MSVSSGYPNPEKRVGNTTCGGLFLMKFETCVWIADETLIFKNEGVNGERSLLINFRPGIQTSFTVVIFFVLT